MSSKEYYRNRIADKRKEIVSLRAKIKDVKEKYKKKSESLSHSIKGTSSKSLKEMYRKQKIDAKKNVDNTVDSLKRKIESYKKEVEKLKDSLSKAK